MTSSPQIPILSVGCLCIKMHSDSDCWFWIGRLSTLQGTPGNRIWHPAITPHSGQDLLLPRWGWPYLMLSSFLSFRLGLLASPTPLSPLALSGMSSVVVWFLFRFAFWSFYFRLGGRAWPSGRTLHNDAIILVFGLELLRYNLSECCDCKLRLG